MKTKYDLPTSRRGISMESSREKLSTIMVSFARCHPYILARLHKNSKDGHHPCHNKQQKPRTLPTTLHRTRSRYSCRLLASSLHARRPQTCQLALRVTQRRIPVHRMVLKQNREKRCDLGREIVVCNHVRLRVGRQSPRVQRS